VVWYENHCNVETAILSRYRCNGQYSKGCWIPSGIGEQVAFFGSSARQNPLQHMKIDIHKQREGALVLAITTQNLE